ncbi:MAG: ABC transporter permease [Acidobacteria bacterium]|nr:ABC transporter permease [Acidobacteriota bacterium]
MNTFWQDLRYGARMLMKQPGFTLIAVVTLALGIGANTAIFSVVNAALLRPLPYVHAEQLVAVFVRTNSDPREYVAWPDLLDWRAQNRSFAQLAAFVPQSVNLTGRTGSQIEPGRVIGGFVSADFFPMLQVTAAQGRAFLPGEDVTGAERVAVVSYETWRDRFGADPQLLGQTLTLNNQPFTVVGVLPAGFRAPYSEIEVWLPIQHYPNFSLDRKVTSAGVFGRLKPGVSMRQAQTEMDTIAARLAQQYPETNKERGVNLVGLQTLLAEQLKPALLVLFGAVGCVLLIACANIANLLLSRAVGRARELALRAALGASRARLLRQLLTESLLLALVSGVIGLLIGVWGMEALATSSAVNLPGLFEIKLDRAVFGFTLGAALLTGLVFGLLPAWRVSRPDLNEALKEGGRTAGAQPSRNRLRGLLVVAQVALSLVLLVGAGLMVRSFANLLGVDPGFDAHNVLTLEYRVPRNKYPEPQQQWRFHEQVVARVQALPGVESAAAVGAIPHGGNSGTSGFTLPERATPPAGQEPRAQTNRADPHYFRTLKIPVLQGRVFTAQDQAQTPPVIIINQTMARQYWPAGEALGRQVHLLSPDVTATVIGVVGDIRHLSLDEPAQPQIYLNYAQQPHIFASLVVRTRGDANSFANAVRAAIWSVDSEQPVWKVRTLEFLLQRSLGGQRFLLQLIGALAGLALLLAAVGIYGVIAYAVSQRTHEIGIRMALGAQRRDVLRLVLGQGLKLVLLGVALGMAAAFALTRLMNTLLFGVGATDPLTFGVVALLLLLVALAACWFPARRALGVEPLMALRGD